MSKNKVSKSLARKRRGLKTKAVISNSDRLRMVVFRSTKHIYAQIISAGDVLVQASTVDKELQGKLSGKNKKDQAKEVGKLIAKRALDKEIKEISFDRAGYKYHGRVRELAEAAREEGMSF